MEDPQKPGRPVASGKGDGPLLQIEFDKPAKGRYVKIVQTGREEGLFWSIHEMKIQFDPVFGMADRGVSFAH